MSAMWFELCSRLISKRARRICYKPSWCKRRVEHFQMPLRCTLIPATTFYEYDTLFCMRNAMCKDSEYGCLKECLLGIYLFTTVHEAIMRHQVRAPSSILILLVIRVVRMDTPSLLDWRLLVFILVLALVSSDGLRSFLRHLDISIFVILFLFLIVPSVAIGVPVLPPVVFLLIVFCSSCSVGDGKRCTAHRTMLYWVGGSGWPAFGQQVRGQRMLTSAWPTAFRSHSRRRQPSCLMSGVDMMEDRPRLTRSRRRQRRRDLHRPSVQMPGTQNRPPDTHC